MMDFIYKLYGYDNFTLYLTIAIIVLIILFVLVLIFGKKDQKLEETKRLQKIELEDAFKKEQEEPKKLEVKEAPVIDPVLEIKKEDEQINAVDEKEAVAISENNKEEMELPDEEQNTEVIVFEPTEKNIIEEPSFEDLPSVKKVDTKDIEEESAPINVEDIPSFSFDEINDSIEKGLNEIESIKKEFNSIEVPEIKEEPKIEVDANEETKSFQPSQVFSSVFVKKEEPVEPTMEIEDKSEPEIKIDNNQEVPKPTLISQEDDDLDLPILKIDEKEETSQPEEPSKKEDLTTFSFDDLIGETYKLK